jgi:hypothetical protein
LAGHEIIRQRRRDLALVRMTPDILYDQKEVVDDFGARSPNAVILPR